MAGVVFSINYMPSEGLTKGSSYANRVNETRDFYGGNDGFDLFHYLSKEEKLDENRVVTEFSDKEVLTPFFNKNGQIKESEMLSIRENLRQNKGNIWHAFVSLPQKDSAVINTIEKATEYIRNNLDSLFVDMGLDPKVVESVCALHLDREHNHIHFAFWEKYASIQQKKNVDSRQYEMVFRKKGKISQKAINAFKRRSNEYISAEKEGARKKSRSYWVSMQKRTINKTKKMVMGIDESKLLKDDIKEFLKKDTITQADIEKVRNSFLSKDPTAKKTIIPLLSSLSSLKNPQLRDKEEKKLFDALDDNIYSFYYKQREKLSSKRISSLNGAADRKALSIIRSYYRNQSRDIATNISDNRSILQAESIRIQREISILQNQAANKPSMPQVINSID